ncbi:hypothetical protein MJD09_10300 [bacterium]|nr:hypothetical protein [bacterium]
MRTKVILGCFAVGMFFTVVFFACQHNLGPLRLEPTLDSIQFNIFTPKCALSGCHVPGGFGPMPLRNTTESFDNLVDIDSDEKPNVKRVKPGDANGSYLIHKIEGRSDIVGDRMPQGGPFLSTVEIENIKIWINELETNE